MLLESLVELRRRQDVDRQVNPAYHKTREVAWMIELAPDGHFKRWMPAGDEGGREGPVPYRRRAGRKPPPYLIVDQYPYIFGDTLDPNEMTAEKAAVRHEMYVELIEELVESADDSAELRALLTFLTSNESNKAFEAAPDDLPRAELIGFRVDGTLLHELEAVRDFWTRKLDAAASQKSRTDAECIICSERKAIPKTQPTELVLGPDRVQLISANENAFESYGLRQSAIAPVCQSCARTYDEAARYLLETDKHHFRVGDVTYVFWSDSGDHDDLAAVLMAPKPKQVEGLLKSPFSAKEPAGMDSDRFHTVALTANTSRLVVREYLKEPVPRVKAQLKEWFRKQRTVDANTGEIGAPLGLYALAGSTVREFKDLSPRTLPTLLSAALAGRSLPRWLLSQALGRARADTNNRLTRPRIALIKMVFNDAVAGDSPQQEDPVTEKLNPDDTRPAYLCGRLLAVLEELQYAALGDVNATVSDRFFGTASTAPATVFGRLLKGAQSHLQKLRKNRRGAYEAINKKIEVILQGLDGDTGFPRTLSIEKQGLFSLGYYHQRAQSRLDAKEAKAAKAAKETEANEAETAEPSPAEAE